MASVTPSVLLVTRDPQIKLVAPILEAEGISSKTVATSRDLERALVGASNRCVVVLDGDVSGEDMVPLADVLQQVRNCALPLLALVPADAEASMFADPQRTAAEEYARKPISGSVLALVGGGGGAALVFGSMTHGGGVGEREHGQPRLVDLGRILAGRWDDGVRHGRVRGGTSVGGLSAPARWRSPTARTRPIRSSRSSWR